MQIGTTNTPEIFWEGKILHNKADHKLQNRSSIFGGFFFVCTMYFKGEKRQLKALFFLYR
jgi:hypothetical protein